MPVQVVHPSERSERFEQLAARLIAAGKYRSAGEVLEAAVDALDREVADAAEKKAWLREAIAAGDASGVAEGDVFARVRERAGLPPRSAR